MKLKEVAIDLTWVRPGKVGGTESCVRNLLDGLSKCEQSDFRFVLLVTKYNAASFENYSSCVCFRMLKCAADSKSQMKRALWQNLHMGALLREQGICVCLEPVYGKPFLGAKRITFFTTIHDLQAVHYPEYFSRARVAWMKLSWRNALKTSQRVIAISRYVKEDILKCYPFVPEKHIKVIYDAVNIDRNDCLVQSALDKYGVKKGGYYYTVSSLTPHKNLITLLSAMAELKQTGSPAFFPLVISGIGGKTRGELDQVISKNKLSGDIIFTSFVSNTERNTLYKFCRAFIFPSIFEGFGMPPVEAMAFGVPVLTTRCASLQEVTDGLCNYVDNPLSSHAWADALEKPLAVAEKQAVDALLEKYLDTAISEQYIALFKEAEYTRKVGTT